MFFHVLRISKIATIRNQNFTIKKADVPFELITNNKFTIDCRSTFVGEEYRKEGTGEITDSILRFSTTTYYTSFGSKHSATITFEETKEDFKLIN